MQKCNVALGSLNVVAERPKPGSWVHIDENSSIGKHLLKKRLELGMRQKEVASMLGVTIESISNWENDVSKPQIHFNPSIAKFLGYAPFAIPSESLAERIRSYRLARGLGHKGLGRIIGVDGSTISCWESGKNSPRKKALRKINLLLST